MKLGSLFSGGGLGDLGFMMAGMEIAFQVEIEEYCQKILKPRWPDVPKWRDIKDVRGSELPAVDIITGGFPCQSFSVAGQRRGKEDVRWLWPEMFRIIQEVRPRWVVGENVPGIIGLALDDVLSDLESEGYETTTLVFPAHVVPPKVPHRRERVWIIAKSKERDDGGYSGRAMQGQIQQSGIRDKPSDVAHPHATRQRGKQRKEEAQGDVVADSDRAGRQEQRRAESGGEKYPALEFCGWREAESGICRVVDVRPHGVERLRMLGNGQVMAVTAWIGQRILEYENNLK